VRNTGALPPGQLEQTNAPQRSMNGFQADVVTCLNVAKLECVSETVEFPPGKVYAFARIKTPIDTMVTLRWYDSNNKMLAERDLNVSRNLSRGFRTYAWKTIWKAGKYSVRLYKDRQEIERSREFTILAQHR
jgi:hypothetical protein